MRQSRIMPREEETTQRRDAMRTAPRSAGQVEEEERSHTEREGGARSEARSQLTLHLSGACPRACFFRIQLPQPFAFAASASSLGAVARPCVVGSPLSRQFSGLPCRSPVPFARRCSAQRLLPIAMGSSWSRMFGVTKIDRNILLLGREGVGKTHLLYRLKGLSPKTGEGIELLPTNAFNHFQIDFHAFERQIEVWDPSGKPSHVSLWNTFYETVFFHVVIYVIDANCYDTLDAKRKAAAVREGELAHARTPRKAAATWTGGRAFDTALRCALSLLFRCLLTFVSFSSLTAAFPARCFRQDGDSHVAVRGRSARHVHRHLPQLEDRCTGKTGGQGTQGQQHGTARGRARYRSSLPVPDHSPQCSPLSRVSVSLSVQDNVRSTLPDDLEFHTSAFVDRSIIVVDNLDDLQPHMLDLAHSLGKGAGAGAGGGGSGGASAEVSKSAMASRKSRAMPESSATR